MPERGLVPFVPPSVGLPAVPRRRPPPPAMHEASLPALPQPSSRTGRSLAPIQPPRLPVPTEPQRQRRPARVPADVGVPESERRSLTPVSEQPAPARRPGTRPLPARPTTAPLRPWQPLPCPPIPPKAYRRTACTCPLCGHFVSVSDIEGGPYDMGLYCQDIGGPVRPGRIRVDYTGKVIDRSHNRRGSITTHPWFDPRFATDLEVEVAELAERIAASARNGALARPGNPD